MSDRITEIRLVNLKVTAKTVWRHVTIETAEGLIGTGEFSFDGARSGIDNRVRKVLRPLIGLPAAPTSANQLSRSDFESCAVISAVDQALTDIAAKRAGVPAWRFLSQNASSDPVRLYANINRRTDPRTPDGFAASAALATSKGFDHIKIAPFDGLTVKNCQTDQGRNALLSGLDLVEAIANALGDTATLMVDCHWRLDEQTALETVDALASLDVGWIECPVPECIEQIDTLLRLRSRANHHGIRLAGLENATSFGELLPYLEAGAYDVIMPDVKYAGGCSGLMSIGHNAARYGVEVSFHNPSGPVSHMASLHCAVAAGGNQMHEMQFEETPKFDRIVVNDMPVAGPCTAAPNQIGLGADLSWDYCNKLAKVEPAS